MSLRHSVQDLFSSTPLYNTFLQRATNCWALLRKTTYQNKASYESSAPCTRPLFTNTSVQRLFVTPLCKEPLIIGLFCGKWTKQIWFFMGLCHPVQHQFSSTPLYTTSFHQHLHTSSTPLYNTSFHQYVFISTSAQHLFALIDTGLRGIIGRPKLQVIFRKRAL